MILYELNNLENDLWGYYIVIDVVKINFKKQIKI